MTLKEKLRYAVERDPDIICDKTQIEETLGSDAGYLREVLGLEKKDLMKLEKQGLALKVRYATTGKRTIKAGLPAVTGPHRIRWLIFQEALSD